MEVDARHVGIDVVHVADGLREDFVVKFFFATGVVFVGYPMVEMREDVAQVGHPVVGGANGVVAQILFNGRGVVSGRRLLQTIAIERVALVLGHKAAQVLSIVFIAR